MRRKPLHIGTLKGFTLMTEFPLIRCCDFRTWRNSWDQQYWMAAPQSPVGERHTKGYDPQVLRRSLPPKRDH